MPKQSNNNKQSRWLKNLGRSALYGVSDSISNRYTASSQIRSDVLEASKDLNKTVRDTLKNRKVLLKKFIDETDIGKALNASYSDLKTSIKTGNLYPSDSLNTQLDDIGFDDDDYSFNDDESANDSFNFDTDEDNSSGESTNLESSSDRYRLQEVASINHLEASNRAGHTMTASSISKLNETIKISTVHTTNSIEKSLKVMSDMTLASIIDSHRLYEENNQTLSAIYDRIGEITSFNSDMIQKFVQGSLVYYDESLTVMKRMLEIEESKLPKETEYKPYESDFSKVFGGGGIDFSALGKTVLKNFQNTPLGLITSFMDAGDGINPFANPVGKLFSMGINTLIPKALDVAVKNIDETMASLAPMVIKKLNNTLSDINFMGIGMGDLLKVKGSKGYIDVSKYTKGPVPFDGITHRTINQVIPTYLSQILTAIKEEDTSHERYFDYERGTWITRGAIKDSYDRDVEYMRNMATSPFRESYLSAKGTISLDKNIEEHLDSLVNTLIKEITNGTVSWKGQNIQELLEQSAVKIDEMTSQEFGILNAALKTMTTAEHLKMGMSEEKFIDDMGRYNSELSEKFNLQWITHDGSDEVTKSETERGKQRKEAEEKEKKRKEAVKKLRENNKGNVTNWLAKKAGLVDDEEEAKIFLSDEDFHDPDKILAHARRRRADNGEKDTKANFTGKFMKYLNDPINLLKDTINKLDSTIYKIFFGTNDDGEESIIDKIKTKVETTFEDVSKSVKETFKDTKISESLGDFRDRAFAGFSSAMLGTKDSNGSYSGGAFSYIVNMGKDVSSYIKQTFTGKDFVDSSGKTIKSKFAGVGDSVRDMFNNGMAHLKNYIFGDNLGNDGKKASDRSLVDNISGTITKGYQIFSNNFFGTNLSEKRAGQEFNVFIKRKLPKAIGKGSAIALGIGAFQMVGGAGILGSLFLPGGPIGALIAGTGISLISSSERFKKMMFGKKDENGKRVGGIITRKMLNFWDKKKTAIIGGGILGGIKAAVIGGATMALGPIGALPAMATGIFGSVFTGAATGLAVKSEAFKNMLFGKEGSSRGDATRKVGAFIKRALPTAGFGALLGGGLGVFGSSFGLVGAMINPWFAAIAGGVVGIGMASERFKTALFGGVDKNGNYKSGLVDRIKKGIAVSIINPLKLKFEKGALAVEKWFVKSIANPLKDAFYPVKLAASHIAKTIKDKMVDFISRTTKALVMPFSPIVKAITGFLRDTFSTLKRSLSRILSTSISLLGKMVASPFKMAAALTNTAANMQMHRQNVSKQWQKMRWYNPVSWAKFGSSMVGYVHANDLGEQTRKWYDYRKYMKKRNAEQDEYFKRKENFLNNKEVRYNRLKDKAIASGFDLTNDEKAKKLLAEMSKKDDAREKIINGQTTDQLTAINQKELELQEAELEENKKHTSLLEAWVSIGEKLYSAFSDGVAELTSEADAEPEATPIAEIEPTEADKPKKNIIDDLKSKLKDAKDKVAKSVESNRAEGTPLGKLADSLSAIKDKLSGIIPNRHSDDNPSADVGGNNASDIKAERSGTATDVLDDDGRFVNTSDSRHTDDDPNKQLGGQTAADIVVERQVQKEKDEEKAFRDKQLEATNKQLDENKKSNSILDGILGGIKSFLPALLSLGGLIKGLGIGAAAAGLMSSLANGENPIAALLDSDKNGTSKQRLIKDSMVQFALRPLAHKYKIDELGRKYKRKIMHIPKKAQIKAIRAGRALKAMPGDMVDSAKALSGKIANIKLGTKVRTAASDFLKNAKLQKQMYDSLPSKIDSLYGEGVYKRLKGKLPVNDIRDVRFNPNKLNTFYKGLYDGEQVAASKTWAGYLTRTGLRLRDNAKTAAKWTAKAPWEATKYVAKPPVKLAKWAYKDIMKHPQAQLIKSGLDLYANKAKEKTKDAIKYAKDWGTTKLIETKVGLSMYKDDLKKFASIAYNKTREYSKIIKDASIKYAKLGVQKIKNITIKSAKWIYNDIMKDSRAQLLKVATEQGIRAAKFAVKNPKEAAKLTAKTIGGTSKTLYNKVFSPSTGKLAEGVVADTKLVNNGFESVGRMIKGASVKIADGAKFVGKGAVAATKAIGRGVKAVAMAPVKLTKKAAEVTADAVKAGAKYGKEVAENNFILNKGKSLLGSIGEKIMASAENENDSLMKKFITYCKKGIETIVKNPTINEKLSKKGLSELAANLLKALGRLTKQAFNLIVPKLTKAIAKTASGMLTAGVATAGFALWDMYSGARDASALFGIPEDKVTAGMRTAAAILQVILGLPYVVFLDLLFEALSLFSNGEIDIKRQLVGWIYEALPGVNEDDMKALGQAQTEDEEARKAYEKELNGDLSEDDENYHHVSKDEWTEKKNKDEENKGGFILKAVRKYEWGKFLFGSNDEETGEYKNGLFANIADNFDKGFKSIGNFFNDVYVFFAGGTYSSGEETEPLMDSLTKRFDWDNNMAWLFGTVDENGNVTQQGAISKGLGLLGKFQEDIKNGFKDWLAVITGGTDSKGQPTLSLFGRGMNVLSDYLMGRKFFRPTYDGESIWEPTIMEPTEGGNLLDFMQEYLVEPLNRLGQGFASMFSNLMTNVDGFLTESSETIEKDGLLVGGIKVAFNFLKGLMGIVIDFNPVTLAISGLVGLVTGNFDTISNLLKQMGDWWSKLDWKNLGKGLLVSLFGGIMPTSILDKLIGNKTIDDKKAEEESNLFKDRINKIRSSYERSIKSGAAYDKDMTVGKNVNAKLTVGNDPGSFNVGEFVGMGKGDSELPADNAVINTTKKAEVDSVAEKSEKTSNSNMDHFISYQQGDSKWSKLAVMPDSPGYGNMQDYGCGPTVLASAMANITGNTKIDPRITASLVQNGDIGQAGSKGVSPAYLVKSAAKLGGNAYEIDTSDQQTLIDALHKGGTVILGGTNHYDSQGPYTKGGHYIMAKGVYEEGGEVYANVYNPLEKGEKGYKIKDLIKGMKDPNKPGFATLLTRNNIDATQYLKGVKYLNPDDVLKMQQQTIFRGYGKSNITGDDIIVAAKKHLGKPYVWGGDGVSGIDCSLLTLMAFKDCGLDLQTRNAQYQHDLYKSKGALVKSSEAKPGDLVFFWEPDHAKGIAHVGIYAGQDTMIHAGSTRGVCFQKIPDMNLDLAAVGSTEKVFKVPPGKGIGEGGISVEADGSDSNSSGDTSDSGSSENPLEKFLNYVSTAGANAASAILSGKEYEGTPLDPPSSDGGSGYDDDYDGSDLNGRSRSSLPKNVIGDPDKFTEYIGKYAKKFKKESKSGVMPSVVTAQAALESGWGKYAAGNNLFGIKAFSDWKGPRVTSRTKEDYGRGLQDETADFRAYPSPLESVKDHDRVLCQSNYNGVRQTKNPYDQIVAIKAGGYATDSEYVSKVWGTLKANNMTRFDGAGLGNEKIKVYQKEKTPKPPSSKSLELSNKMSMFGGGNAVAAAITSSLAKPKFDYKPKTTYETGDIAPDYDDLGNIVAKDLPVNNRVTKTDSITVLQAKQDWQKQWWEKKSKEEKELIKKANKAIEDAKKKDEKTTKEAEKDADKKTTSLTEQVKEKYEEAKEKIQATLSGAVNKITGSSNATDKAIETLTADTSTIVNAIKSLDVHSELNSMINYLKIIADHSSDTSVAVTKTASAVSQGTNSSNGTISTSQYYKRGTSKPSVPASAAAKSRNMPDRKNYDALHNENLRIAKGGEFKRG